jgi:hypothetical protein
MLVFVLALGAYVAFRHSSSDVDTAPPQEQLASVASRGERRASEVVAQDRVDGTRANEAIAHSQEGEVEVDRTQELRSLERKILGVISENPSTAHSIDVQCSITRCEAILVAPTRGGFVDHFLTVLTRELMKVGVGPGSLGIQHLPAGTTEYTMNLPSLEAALLPVDAEGRVIVSVSRQDLEDFLSRRLHPDEYDNAPARLGRFGEASVVAEVHCRRDCSEDAQRLLRLEPDVGKSCRDVGGREIHVVLPGTGVTEEVCVPEFFDLVY